MHLTSLLALSAAAASVAAAPYKIPTADGFPNPNPAQLLKIEKVAGGTVPNGPLPKRLKPTGVATLELIALNELFEVAFFTDLLANITHNVHGYTAQDIHPLDREYVIASIGRIIEQEKLHALGANGILKNAGQAPIAPCTYQFPVTSFLSAITLAQTFTDVVLGTLQGAQAAFAADAGDESALIPLIGSVIGQEGEQVGFFRYAQKKLPSAAPFLTGSDPNFAFTALNSFIVPGSCPKKLDTYGLTKFGALEVVTPPKAKNMKLEFSVEGKVDSKENAVVYISGQNVPVTVGISEPKVKGGVSSFFAEFPFEKDGFSNGLTIAALVKGKGKFASNAAVAKATVFGPGLIEVN